MSTEGEDKPILGEPAVAQYAEIPNDNPEPNYYQLQDDNVDKFLLVIKYLNMVAGAFVSVVGFYFVFTLNLWRFSNVLMSLYSMFLPVFYILFGILLFAAEYFKDEVSLYFRFVRSFIGRGMFNIFLATQCNLVWDTVGEIVGWILMTLGIVYVFLYFIKGKMTDDVQSKLLD